MYLNLQITYMLYVHLLIREALLLLQLFIMMFKVLVDLSCLVFGSLSSLLIVTITPLGFI